MCRRTDVNNFSPTSTQHFQASDQVLNYKVMKILLQDFLSKVFCMEGNTDRMMEGGQRFLDILSQCFRILFHSFVIGNYTTCSYFYTYWHQ